jgi:hypothetical protein
MTALDNILLTNVCVVRFTRKRRGDGKSPTRKMLCTKSYELLNSTNGKLSLNYKAPTGPTRFNEAAEGVLVVWDILMQDYRCINLAQVNILETVPVSEFWPYFNENIYPMSPEQKITYMAS